MSALQQTRPSASLDSRKLDFVAVLDHLGVLQVSGDDAADFLQGQLSCDVQALRPRESSFGAYCTPQGRMLASLLLWRDGTGFFAALSRDLAAPTQKQLSKFFLRSRVKVVDASDSIVLVGAAGASAERMLAASPGASLRLKDGRLLLAFPAAEAQRHLQGVDVSGAARWRWLDI